MGDDGSPRTRSRGALEIENASRPRRETPLRYAQRHQFLARFKCPRARDIELAAEDRTGHFVSPVVLELHGLGSERLSKMDLK